MAPKAVTRVLVTGGNGFVGRRAVEMALEHWRGCQVRSFDLFHSWEGEGVEVFNGDLTKKEDCKRACEGCQVVIHVASYTELTGAKEVFEAVNVVGASNLVDAASEAGVGVFVYTSTSSVVYNGSDVVNGDETRPICDTFLDHYTDSKARAEKIILGRNREGGIRTAAIRPHSIYGPRDRHYFPKILHQASLGKMKFVLGDGSVLSSYTFVDNCVHAHLLAADKLLAGDKAVSGQAFFVNDGEPANFWGVMKRICVAMGHEPAKIGYRRIPAGVAYAIGTVNGMVFNLFANLLPPGGTTFTKFSVCMATTHHYYDCQKAKKLLGYKPVKSHDEAMTTTFQWMRENGYEFKGQAAKPKSAPVSWFGVYMYIVSAVTLCASFQALWGRSDWLSENQFGGATPLTQRLFGAWTLLAACLRFSHASDPTNLLVARGTFFTFLVAFGVYAREAFVTQTIPIEKAITPLLTASLSALGMLFRKTPR